ncbi:MAG: ParB/RepB/Spo0J family partition protein [Candidatus Cloacimonetes bacterium]|nr:ParB/RepB/Spo0J family partition protein [Candidatus Cloacimonadota bacterium]
MSSKMSRLGRGIEVLIPDVEEPVPGGVTTVDVSYIKANKYQPRKKFDQEKLQELSESIKENGLIQPIVVCQNSDTDYELIAGERRLEACKMAGLTTIPVYIRAVTEKERLVLAIIENVQREDLTPIEEARAYQQLIDEFSLTHLDVAKIMSKDRATVTNALRLLKLSEGIQAMIENKEISSGHARAILSVSEEKQEEFARDIVTKQYTVRKAEEEAPAYNAETGKVKKPPKSKILEPKYIRDIENNISGMIGYPVKIKEKKNGAGEIVIAFQSADELDLIATSLKDNK